ncbi:MAG: beta-galactosidase [Geminicoccaceae bacterium]
MLGVCYYPEHWPEDWWAEDARRMREIGITYVRIGEFAWSRIEPERDLFDWEWLDRAMDVLGAAGLKVVLGTPTATPPKWLVDGHPEMLAVDREGRLRGFGSRRHYNFSDPSWHAETDRIVEAIAKRYGRHPALVGWQTDNEYGCHDTILSYATADRIAFRDWLRRRYQTPGQLNEAWGNTFWSMELRDWAEVELPNLTVTEANPAAWLDFWRFASDQVVAYNRRQVEIIRAHSPDRWITHNFMGLFHDFDHWAVGADLDLSSWDSYPLGFVERFPFTEAERNRWAPTSHPDMASFHHDLYRGVGRGRWWVMEQQPGPVNWAPWNPTPLPGMVRLWTWEALAHGAEVVSYFRWRQAPFAQEQMHAGLNRPDRALSPGGHEATRVGRELQALSLGPSRPAEVAFLFDYEASWITRIQPQGADFSYLEMTYRWYEALRRLGLDVDFVRPGAPLDGYRAVIVPTLPHVSDAALRAFQACTGVVLYGPRTGSKTRSLSIPETLPPGPLQALLPMRVAEVASLRPGLEVEVSGSVAGSARRWRERVETSLTPLATFPDGSAAFVARGNHHYLASWPDGTLLDAVLRHVLAAASVTLTPVPDHVRLRRRGDLTFAFNYGPEPWPLPEGARPVMGDTVVGAQDLACWRAG